MLRGVIITGIIMLLVLSSMGGMASGVEEKKMHGFFKGNVFNNLRIMVEINEDYATIKNAKDGETLVEKAYPVIEIKEGKEWREIEFEEKFIEVQNHGGWHTVAIGFAHTGKIAVRGFLEYYQRKKVGEGAPLYPLLLLYFNKSVEHRVVWRYEGIATNWFEVIDNGTGETRAPFKEGHARRVIYNGTIQGKMEFEDGQDIVVAWKNGVKEFGSNWEREKLRYKTLKFDVEDRVNMEIVEDESNGKMLKSEESRVVDAYGLMAWDSGGGGSDPDSDGDGLSDSTEEAGWYIWVCTSGTTWHHIKVYSDPHYKDTDNDGVDDKAEYDHGTDPEDSDTDDDGLNDSEEIYTYGTYAYTWDSDENGISDNDEFHNWLFMLYMDADNSLYKYMSDVVDKVFQGLSGLTSDGERINRVMHIVIEYDGKEWGDSGRYEIRFNTATWQWEKVKVDSWGDLAMCEPRTLSDFVNWAASKYWQPNRRALIIMDHGGGWDGLLWDDSVSGDNYTDMNELKRAFGDMKTHINLVWFDACLCR